MTRNPPWMAGEKSTGEKALPAEAVPVLRPGDLLSVAQALQLLPVGRATLYRLVAEGTLPAVRVASLGSRRGRVLVIRAGLEAYVAGLRAPAASRPAGRGGLALDVDALRTRVLGRAVRPRWEAR